MNWPLANTHWRLARDLLQPADAGSADSTASPYSLSEWTRVVYGDSIPLYPELFVSENCSAAFRGVRITYVQVYKSNTQGICGNLLRLHDGSDRPDSPAFTFTFVRDPMAHFVSGFSEISYHARRSQRAFDREPFRGKPGVPHCRQFSQRNASAQQAAAAQQQQLENRLRDMETERAARAAVLAERAERDGGGSSQRLDALSDKLGQLSTSFDERTKQDRLTFMPSQFD